MTTTVTVLQSRRNTQAEDWTQTELAEGGDAGVNLHRAANDMNTALGWPKYRAISFELDQPEFPIEPTHPRRGKPKTGYRQAMEDGNTVTASPSWLCVWRGAPGGQNLIGGPFSCPDDVREPADLVGWYNGWLDAGSPS